MAVKREERTLRKTTNTPRILETPHDPRYRTPTSNDNDNNNTNHNINIIITTTPFVCTITNRWYLRT